MTPRLVWRCRERTLRLGARPLVMGILNVTPDSFSDGGIYRDVAAAIRHGLEMAEAGADVIDVGGESTRPGAQAVTPDEEAGRVIPVVRALVCAFAGKPGAPVLSVDTRKASVAKGAMEAGAGIINDVTALEGDSDMVGVVREYGAGVILMHMKGDPTTMQQSPQYEDVVAEVSAYLAGRVAALKAAGLPSETMALDPGIGFGKTVEHNVKLIANLQRLVALGQPVVIGLSRKSFISKITGREVAHRLAGSLAGAVWAAGQGAHIWRVHDVAESVDAARMVGVFREGTTVWNG
ncbi:MAG: dihydropteroate synthase [bacterium]